jgi:feruloyl esterase
MINRTAEIIFIAAIGLFLFASPTAASGKCESLTSLELPDGKITSATLVEAGKFTPPMGGGPMMGGVEVYKNAPAFCRVTATLAPTSDSDIKVEVWMPSENWNGKLVGVGNGVWAGNIGYSAMAEPLSRGYATAATDTGHVGSGMDAKFAVGHKEKLIDFGYRAIHEMTTNAKSIIKEYYGKEERMSFWVSCSTGGRQGLMEAYRYPEDYDGISAMATNFLCLKSWLQTKRISVNAI